MKVVRYHRWPMFFFLLLLVASCSSSGDNDPPPPMGNDDDDPIVVPDPLAATLIFPDDDTECNEGEALNDTESLVTFQWNASQNTDSYSVTLTNLNTNATFNTVANTNEAPIVILRGTPYEWFVTSRANGTTVTAQSATWRFFNEGPGIENYAPFPAEAVNPAMSATLTSNTTSVTLQWSGSDVDDDIVEYEVFFGLQDTDTLPSLGTTSDSSFTVAVSADNQYTWQIKTIDGQGNSSVSENFQFKVQ